MALWSAEDPNRPDISIVVPVLNEERNLKRGTLWVLDHHLARMPRTSEVVVVDGGSSDSTVELVRRFAASNPRFSLVELAGVGKGRAVSEGIRRSRARNVLFMDVDLSTDLAHVDEAVGLLDSGCADVIIGSREAPGASRLSSSAARLILSRSFNTLVQLLILPGFSDTQCGFKAFSRMAANEIFEVQASDGLSFDVEVLTIARARGLRTRELPVTWRHVDSKRIRLFREPALMFWQLLCIWLNHRRGKYRA